MADLYEPLVDLGAQPPPPPKSGKETGKTGKSTPKTAGGRNVADGCTAVSAVTSNDQTAYTFTPEVGPQNGIDVKDEVTPRRNKLGTYIMIVSAVLVVIFLAMTVFFAVAFAIKL
uniref:Triple QxxK/R motif-containing protein n=1 Tax=Panagrellus redivivus TaxID=6233 RepID=A0A7E4VYQ7_PANRE